MKHNESTWSELTFKHYPILDQSLSVDVAIIGGGITGALSTYILSKQGKKVTLIEKNTIASGATMMTTAFLTQSLDTDFSDLIKIFGEDRAERIVDSHRDAIDCIEKIIKDEHIDCDFTRCSNYIFTDTEKDHNYLKEECAAMQKLGVHCTIEIPSTLTETTTGAVEIHNQAKFHPLKFIKGILEAAEKYGAIILEHTDAREIVGNRIHTPLGGIHANWIISATYEPFGSPLGLFFKKGTYVSYVYELEMESTPLPEGTYEDTDNPYHYFRVDKKGDTNRIIVGGEDHRQDIPVDPEKNFAALRKFIEKIFPGKKYTLTREWSGPILEPVDGLAFIGPHKEPHILYAMGFSGNGMTYSMIAALIFFDIIFGKKNTWLPLYSANRISSFKSLMIKGRDYMEELFRGAVKNTLSK